MTSMLRQSDRTHCGAGQRSRLASARYASCDEHGGRGRRCTAAGAHHGRRGQPGPAGAARCSPPTPASSTARRPRPTSSSTSARSDHDRRARRRENVTDGAAGDARRRHRRRRRPTSCWCRRRWSTAPTPTTRCRSPRTPSCGPTSTSCTPASWPPSRRWSSAGGARGPAARSRCCARSWRWPPTARRRWPRRSPPGYGQRFGEDDPPAQFLHLDDLASAVVLAVDRRLDGVFNVAPDGWVAGERVRALSGGRPRIRLPDRLARSSPPSAGGSSGARSRPACAATPASRGWSPTTGSRRRAGARR